MRFKTKKAYAVISLFLFAVTPSFSQLKIGPKVGLNLSDVVINNVVDPDTESGYRVKAGIHAGVFVVADIAPRTAFVSEILYSNKGVKAATAINLHYISFPLLIRYRLSERFYAEGGPEISYLMTASSKYGNANATWDNKLDLGLDAGIIFELSETIVTGLRFNAGFSSVIRNPDNASNPEPIRYQNRVLQLSVGYQLFGDRGRR